MRIDLKVPFIEKDQARALGARWDPARRVWYIVDQCDLLPFAAWIPALAVQQPERLDRPGRRDHGVRRSKRTDFSLPDCCCVTPPWEDCEHTLEPPLTGEALAHIRSI